MFAFIRLHQQGMEILVMAKQLVYVSVELFTMIQRLEKKIHPKLVYAAISYAMLNLAIKFKSLVRSLQQKNLFFC